MQKLRLLLLTIFCLTVQSYASGQAAPLDTSNNGTGKNLFQIDTTITNFKLANISENGFIYTPNGAKDLRSDSQSSGFNIMPINNMTFAKGLEFLEYMASTFKEEGSTITDFKKVDTVINGKRIFETSFLAKDNSQKIKHVYQAFIFKDNSIIAFMGMDVEGGELISKFRKTFTTIQF